MFFVPIRFKMILSNNAYIHAKEIIMYMLNLKRAIISSLILTAILILSACSNDNDTRLHTIRFVTNGGSAVSPLQVENGRRIPGVSTPSRDGNFEFIGWFEDDDTFLEEWNFEIDIVTRDITLYAHWGNIERFPTEAKMTDDPFSSSVHWVQTGVTDLTDFEVTLYLGTPQVREEEVIIDGVAEMAQVEYYSYSEEGILVEGTHTITNDTKVTWIPDSNVQGGVYEIKILTNSDEEVTFQDMWFKGEGTEENPHLIFESKDIRNLANGVVSSVDKFYRVMTDFEHISSYADILNNTFSGQFDGNNKNITITGNAGLFYEIGTNALIENLVIRGTLDTASTPLIGAIAHENYGRIQKTTSWIKITSSAGEVGNPDTKLVGGAAGFVGINHEGARIEDSRFRSSGSAVGVIKARIGAAGIASINYGTIYGVENRGAMGAFNAVESGRSLSRYSYMGGIAAFNYGVIEKSNTTSVGKLLAQRFLNVTAPDGQNNRVIGGIVGYNAGGAIVRESYFNGIRVHGDQYVGGIAGINAGLIVNSYAGARFYSSTGIRSYVGGRLNVGGIAGLLEGDGRIENSYASINVYAYEDTPYAIAEEAFNSIYITLNHDSRSSGDQEYGFVTSDQLIAPNGTSNTAVDNAPLTKDDGVHYKLPGSYSNTLGSPFVENENQTILAWELE